MKIKSISFLLTSILPFSVLATSILQVTDQTKNPNVETNKEISVNKNMSQEEKLTQDDSEDIPLVEGPSAHLTFHMGLAAEGQNFVGGSIENKGKVAVHGGYVVILPLDEKCNPLTPILHPVEKVPAGETLSFKIPVQQSLSAYRVIGFNAYDDMGFEVPSTDDTIKIIEKRMPEERKACEKKRIQQ